MTLSRPAGFYEVREMLNVRSRGKADMIFYSRSLCETQDILQLAKDYGS